jgi:hypothetical protein
MIDMTNNHRARYRYTKAGGILNPNLGSGVERYWVEVSNEDMPAFHAMYDEDEISAMDFLLTLLDVVDYRNHLLSQ